MPFILYKRFYMTEEGYPCIFMVEACRARLFFLLCSFSYYVIWRWSWWNDGGRTLSFIPPLAYHLSIPLISMNLQFNRRSNDTFPKNVLIQREFEIHENLMEGLFDKISNGSSLTLRSHNQGHQTIITSYRCFSWVMHCRCGPYVYLWEPSTSWSMLQEY